MMRAIGFLSGVGLTVAAFLLALDALQRPESETVAESTAHGVQEQASGPAASGPTPDQQQDVAAETTREASPDEVSAALAAVAEQVDAPRTTTDPDRATPTGARIRPAEGNRYSDFETSEADPRPRTDMQAESRVDAPATDSSGASRHLFWSPFRSAWSAQGFARRLTAATQVPVEVVDTAPGRYRVAFSYSDETERRARIRRIETVTGLQLE